MGILANPPLPLQPHAPCMPGDPPRQGIALQRMPSSPYRHVPCAADALIPYQHIEGFMEQQAARGTPVHRHRWDDTAHCEHLRKHPEQYKSLVGALGGASQLRGAAPPADAPLGWRVACMQILPVRWLSVSCSHPATTIPATGPQLHGALSSQPGLARKLDLGTAPPPPVLCAGPWRVGPPAALLGGPAAVIPPVPVMPRCHPLLKVSRRVTGLPLVSSGVQKTGFGWRHSCAGRVDSFRRWNKARGAAQRMGLRLPATSKVAQPARDTHCSAVGKKKGRQLGGLKTTRHSTTCRGRGRPDGALPSGGGGIQGRQGPPRISESTSVAWRHALQAG